MNQTIEYSGVRASAQGLYLMVDEAGVRASAQVRAQRAEQTR
jgi:hypothetical protein